MKHNYRVTLPIDVDGKGVIHPGTVIELEDEQAKDYAHALIRIEEEKGTANAQ